MRRKITCAFGGLVLSTVALTGSGCCCVEEYDDDGCCRTSYDCSEEVAIAAEILRVLADIAILVDALCGD